MLAWIVSVVEPIRSFQDTTQDAGGRSRGLRGLPPSVNPRNPRLCYASMMGAFRRVILIVLDSCGIGAMPDAAAFGDPPGGDTLGNIDRLHPLKIPNLERMGLGNIKPFAHLHAAKDPRGCFGKATLASPGKDTTTGHWEMVGIILDQPFPLYPHG